MLFFTSDTDKDIWGLASVDIDLIQENSAELTLSIYFF